MNNDTLLAVARVLKELKAEYASEFSSVNEAVTELGGAIRAVDAKTAGRIQGIGDALDLRLGSAEADLAGMQAELKAVQAEAASKLQDFSDTINSMIAEQHGDTNEKLGVAFEAVKSELYEAKEKLAVLIEKGNTFTCLEISKHEAAVEEARAEDLVRIATIEEELKATDSLRSDIQTVRAQLAKHITDIEKQLTTFDTHIIGLGVNVQERLNAQERSAADVAELIETVATRNAERFIGVEESVEILSSKVIHVERSFNDTLAERIQGAHAEMDKLRDALANSIEQAAQARALDKTTTQALIDNLPDLVPDLDELKDWSGTVEGRWQAFEKQVFNDISEVGLCANKAIEELSNTVTELVGNAVKGLAEDQDTLAENLSTRMDGHSEQLGTVCTSVAEVAKRVTTMHEVHTLDLEHPRAIAGRMYRYDNALWMCHKDTTELPHVSNPDWELRQDALSGLSVNQDTLETLAVVETWAGGKTKTHVIELPHINYLKTWDETLLYNKYDSVIDDGHRWIAVKDNPSGHPHKSADWFLFGMRGPQGKRGQKGERGLQGAPGETHSVDTIVRALIAFKDRGEGVELGKFRGPWVYQSSYARTDVVTHTEAIYVALVDNDGMMAPTGSPSEPFNNQWMLVYNVSVPQIPKNAVLYTSADDFIPGETVVPAYTQMSRNGWLVISNKSTSDYPDPQNSGIQSADMPESPTWDVDPEHIGVVRTVHQYTLTQPGFIKALEVEVPDTSPDIDYRFYASVQRPGQDVRSMVFDHPVLVADSWVLLGVDDSPHPNGTVFTVVSQALNSAENTTWEHNWDYSGTSNAGTPAAGDWNRRSQQDVVRVSFEAEDGDQQLNLSAVTPGSLIRFSNAANAGQYWEYYVTGVTENTGGSCFEYDVDLNAVGPSGDIPGGATCAVTATIPTPLATKYKQITDYWLTGQPDWATVEGAVEFDGVAQVAEEDNAHGIRLTFQPAYVSPDWDFLAHTT